MHRKPGILEYALRAICYAVIVMSPSAAWSAPEILYTDITSGPNTGGEANKGCYLSIFGRDFGAVKGDSKVLINGAEVGAYKYWGPESQGLPGIQRITVQPGSGVSSGTIQVVVGGDSSNANHTFTVRSGDIYFVSPTGDDSTGEIGNISKPYRHIHTTYERSDFGPGDLMVVMPADPGWGTLSEDTDHGGSAVLTLDKNATANAPMTIYGYPSPDGSWPKLGLANGAASLLVRTPSSSGGKAHQQVANFFIDKGVENPCATGGGSIACGNQEGPCDGFRAVNIEIVGGGYSDGGSSSIMEVQNTANSKFLGIEIHDTCPTSGNEKYHMFYLGENQHYNAELGYSHLYNNGNGGAAIQTYADKTTPVDQAFGAIEIHHNVVHDVKREAILIGRNTGGPVDIHHNVIYESGKGNAFTGALRLTNDCKNNCNELIANVRHNTFANIGGGFIIHFNKNLEEAQPTYLFRNNIFHVKSESTLYFGASGGDFDAYTKPYITSDHNIWYGSSQEVPSWASGPINSDPKFVNAAANNFELQANSPAIGAAVPSGDLGALPFGEDSVDPVDPPSTPGVLVVE